MVGFQADSEAKDESTGYKIGWEIKELWAIIIQGSRWSQ